MGESGAIVRTDDGGTSWKQQKVPDNPKVLFTAFAGNRQGQRAYTLHVANLRAEREVTLRGVPAGVRELRAVRTNEAEEFRDLPPVRPDSGMVEFRMPARCLLTLTTYSAAARGGAGSAEQKGRE